MNRQITRFRHLYLLLDGSESMGAIEKLSKKPKHRAVAEMIQDLLNGLHDDPQFDSALVTIICFDSDNVAQDVRLDEYDVKRATRHYVIPSNSEPRYPDEVLNQWDPLIGHGYQTPIGRVLQAARLRAENWIKGASIGTRRRAIIFLLSDGMNYPKTEPSGEEEKVQIITFNENAGTDPNLRGIIQLGTVGYYQGDNSEEEAAGRELLTSLATIPRQKFGYFESGSAKEIMNAIRKTMTLADIPNMLDQE